MFPSSTVWKTIAGYSEEFKDGFDWPVSNGYDDPLDLNFETQVFETILNN